jgi:hypothetical protein
MAFKDNLFIQAKRAQKDFSNKVEGKIKMSVTKCVNLAILICILSITTEAGNARNNRNKKAMVHKGNWLQVCKIMEESLKILFRKTFNK